MLTVLLILKLLTLISALRILQDRKAACICYCMCDFEFEYSFINFLGNNIHFYVYLKGYEEDEYSLWGDLIYP